jgi:hypothetical protein
MHLQDIIKYIFLCIYEFDLRFLQINFIVYLYFLLFSFKKIMKQREIYTHCTIDIQNLITVYNKNN